MKNLNNLTFDNYQLAEGKFEDEPQKPRVNYNGHD